MPRITILDEAMNISAEIPFLYKEPAIVRLQIIVNGVGCNKNKKSSMENQPRK